MNVFASTQRAFAEIFGTKLPDTPAAPEHSTDSTGVITGNDDLVPAAWTPWGGPNERPPLPVYPNPHKTRAACEAQLARVDGHFDGLEALARSIIAKGYADGIFPDRRKEERS